MSRWHNTRLNPSDWTDDVVTDLLRERLPDAHIPTERELESGGAE